MNDTIKGRLTEVLRLVREATDLCDGVITSPEDTLAFLGETAEDFEPFELLGEISQRASAIETRAMRLITSSGMMCAAPGRGVAWLARVKESVRAGAETAIASCTCETCKARSASVVAVAQRAGGAPS